MAEDKRKILENARKYAQKGAQDKALKEYQKLVKLDPKDAKLRLEIGDAYRRWGKNDEALSTYQKVADQYMREGFDARAVAVYKQILTLAPDHHAAYEPLAELYERMGLTAEAIAALQTAADGYHKQGKKREALELLRKMATIDPTNTTSRIKVAELLRQEKLVDEAIAEYTQVAAELERQSDFDAASNVYRRLLELEPNRDAALGAFGRNLLRQNKAPEAESVARRAIASNAEEPAHYELLADALRAQNREDKLSEAYKPLAELFSRRGDDVRAREIAQRYLPQSELSAESAFGDNFDADALGSSGGLDLHPENARGLEAGSDDGFESGEDIELDDDLSESSPEIELTNVAGDDIDAGADDEDGDEPVIERPEGDPDQLFAEASVYLRYGKSDKAIAHLQAIIEQAPNHRGALEKLGEAYAERGDEGEAVKLWVRAAKRAQAEGATDAAGVLRDRIQALDPKAAAALGPAPKKAAPPPPEPPKPTPVQVKVKSAPAPKPAPPVQREPDPEPDIDVDLGEEEMDLDVDLSEVESDQHEASLQAAPETAVDPVDLATAASDTGIEGASLSTATTQQILEDLEEADFYLEQGLMDEAAGLFKRVLAIAPNHPRALVRLGELEAARGSDPAAAAGAKPAAAKPAAAKPAAKPAGKPTPAAKAPAREIAIEEPDLDISIDEELSPPAAAASEAPDDEIAAAFDVDGTAEPEPSKDPNEETPAFAGSLPEHEVARPAPPPPPTPQKVSKPAPAPVAAKPRPAPAPPPPVVQAAQVPEELTAPEEESGDFDLAAELSDAFDDANGKSGSGNVDFETVFAAFKKGVSQTLDAEDYEAHYDLGIAYKEMGLWPDAINEFRTAMGNRARETECLHLIGLCGLESGDYGLAIEHLERLLGRTGLAKDQALAARFDLGRTLAAADRRDEARIAFQAVAAQDPDFQDVAAQLKALDKPKKSGDASESFDDLLSEMSDDDAESEEKKDAKGESFDDLFADGDEAAADAPEAAEPEPEPAPAPAKRPAPRAPAPAPSGGGSGKKKKKISFL